MANGKDGLDAAFEQVAHAKYAWQRGDQWQSHTLNEGAACARVAGYDAFLRHIACWTPRTGATAIDIGAGAAYITKAFRARGYDMVASEYSEDGVNLIRRENPDIPAVQIDMSIYHQPGAWDFIFSREVYLITRVNAFTDQRRTVSNMLDSLKPGGVFLLAGSDVTYPDCMDYDRIVETFDRDERVRRVTGKHLEMLFRRFPALIRGPLSYRLLHLLFTPLLWWMKRRGGWANTYLIAFVRR